MVPEARVAAPVTEVEAAAIARTYYGLDVEAQSLPGEYDNNFRLNGSDGRSYILKVMHGGRERSFIDMQQSVLQHLAQRAPHLALPRLCPAQDGSSITQASLQDGQERLVWLLTFLPGTALAEVRPHTLDLLEGLGRFLGEMDAALRDFSHPATRRELKWDLAQAGWIRDYLHHIVDPPRRQLAEYFLALYENEVVPTLLRLRKSVIHGDANDYNVLVSAPWPQPRKVVSVIDFGDMHSSATVCELAVAMAYAILGKENPLQAAAAVVGGYHAVLPLDELELPVLFPLAAARLVVSVVNSAHRKALVPDDPYVTISEAPAWAALEKLARIHPRFARAVFRNACGLPATPQSEKLGRWFHANGPHMAPVLDVDLRTQPVKVLDLSVGSTFLGSNPADARVEVMTEAIFRAMKDAGVSVGVGRYNEPRPIYVSALFAGSNPLDERRTIHLGIDLFAEPGTPVHAPWEGVVHLAGDNLQPLDYGPVVILRHTTDEGQEFFTLYGHLSRETLRGLRVGERIEKGRPFASLGMAMENGGWPPHLHFQIILDLLDLNLDFPGVAKASERGVWTGLSPDPNLLLNIPRERLPLSEPDLSATLKQRKELLGPNLSVSYQHPLKIVRGWRQHLYDHTGRVYLDVYNNVPLVGHSHPRVVGAAQKQLALLNTNTRYLHDTILRYAERLTSHLPERLKVCYFLNSGSEANELALRLARAYTGGADVIVLEHAYHGNTSTLIEISPYKFNGPGGGGRKPWVHVAPIADDYRGLYRGGEADLGRKYAGHVAEILARLSQEGRKVAAFIAETLPSVAGQIVFPPGYLNEVYRQVRAAGGVCIADEVQVGFGRLGTHFWGFETQGVTPDIVVLGKPIGNGFPLAAVITTPQIATAFNNGMEFFSTFGGNPVACAAGLAVLDVVEEEHLQQNALRTGNYLIAKLQQMQRQHEIIGDVRGSGLFLGLDLVRNRDTREPASDQASYISNRLRDCGILTGTDGPHHNVIKLRPPLILSEADADLFVAVLDAVLEEDAARG